MTTKDDKNPLEKSGTVDTTSFRTGTPVPAKDVRAVDPNKVPIKQQPS